MHTRWWLVLLCLVPLAAGFSMHSMLVGPGGGSTEAPENLGPGAPEHWSIQQMSYTFNFPLSCDVDVEQTVVVNYTGGNFSSGIMYIPRADYDALEFDRISTDNSSEYLKFTTITDGDMYRIHYEFPTVTAPATKSFTFTYKALQATKTFSRSGSSSNSFSWETINNKFPTISMLHVTLNLTFHTASEDSIESNPQYEYVELQDKYTTIVFPPERNIPEGTTLTHQISFPKRVTCKPASSYKIVAIAVVAGSICFALCTTLVALIVRKIKQRKDQQFEQLSEVT